MKHKQKRNNFLRTVMYIFSIAVVAVTAYIGFYAYSVANHSPIITIGVNESYTFDITDSTTTVRSYDAHIVAPLSGSTVEALQTGEAGSSW